MERVRKDLFIAALRKAGRLEIRHRWAFDGMRDGIEYTGHMVSRRQFLKSYGPGTHNYRIMRVWHDGNGFYSVSDQHGGAIYHLDAWIMREQDRPNVLTRKPKQPKRAPGKGTLILGTRSYKIEPCELDGFVYRLTGERGARYILRRDSAGTLYAWNENRPTGTTPFDGMRFTDSDGLPMLQR